MKKRFINTEKTATSPMTMQAVRDAINEADYTGDEYAAYKTPVLLDAQNMAQMQQKLNAQPVRFRIENVNAADKEILLSPGLIFGLGTLPNGVIREAAVGSEFAATDDTAAAFNAQGQGCSIEKFLHFIRLNPCRLVGFKISGTKVEQVTQGYFKIATDNPFKSIISEDTVFFSSYTDENRNQDKEVTARMALDFDNQKMVKMMIPGASTTIITLFIGKIENLAAASAQA